MVVTLQYHSMVSVLTSILLLGSCGHTQGAVTISPSGIVSVCSGGQLEWICTVTDSGSFGILVWNITLITDDATAPMSYTRLISSSSPSDQTSYVMINSTRLTLSRISAQNNIPLISRLVISPVSSSLNGTNVNCLDAYTSESSSVAVVRVTNSHPIQDIEGVNLTDRCNSENDHVLMMLEWTLTDPTYSYHIVVVPYLPVSLSASTQAQIRIPYNTAYNVSVLVSSCGQYTVTAFFEEVFYSSTNCGNPAYLLNDRVRVFGFMESPIIYSSVEFGCPPRMIINGPNSSTCMGDGEWEPDPREVNCTASCGPPSLPTNGYLIPYTSTLEGAMAMYICWNIHQKGRQSQCEEVNVTAVCSEHGYWEPNTEDICADPTGGFLSEDGKIAVASSVSTFVITSVMFFTIGYLCRHYRQKPKSDLPIPVINKTPVYENVVPEQITEKDLELKENVAYGPVAVIRFPHAN